ncbi:MAG: ABC transporter transmembrane domain-containing protein [Magnetospirillum sp. WYHS-4]
MAESRPNFFRSLSRVALGRIDVLLSSFAINLLSLALPLVILQVYDRIIPNQATDTFSLLMAALLLSVVLDAVLRSIRSRITTWSGARFEHATSRRAVERLLGARIENFEAVPPGTHVDRLAAIDALRDFHSGQSLIALADLPFVVLFLALIGLIGGSLVLAPLAVALVALGYAATVAWRLDRAVERRTELDNARYNFVFQSLNGVHSVKALGLEAQMCRQYESIHAPLARAVYDVAYLSAAAQSVGSMFGGLTMMAVAAAGGLMVVGGHLSNGALVAAMLLAGRAVQPLLKMIGVWTQSRTLKLAEQRLDDLLTLPQEEAPARQDDQTPVLAGWIRLEDVTVHRGRPDFPVLSHANLEIFPGEMVALVGETGGGRATVLDLIAGLARPDEGRLVLDGVDAARIDFRELRKQIAYVRQFAVLFRGSLQDNLTRFRGREYLASALDVANRMGLDETIARLPAGLQTRVGDMASEALAGSVQQVVALVRALADRPRLLLFDEANSAFDMAADSRLRGLLLEMRGRTTVIMVTGRPSLISLADRIFRVEDGNIVEIDKTRPSLEARRG